MNGSKPASTSQSAPAEEREAFEALMRIGGYSNTEKHPDGSYISSAMELWWQGWKARAAWQRTQSAGVPEGWRDALQKIARHAPPVNCAAKTEVEKLALIAVHALIAFSAPQFSKPTDHQSAKVGTAAPAQPAAQQVGQEPAVPECVERIRTLFPRFEAGVNWTGEDAAELAEAAYDAAELLTTKPAPDQDVAGVLEWAVDRWHAEVANRPLNNVHRRTLDDSWRQVIRKLGGDPGLLCGPAHDALAASAGQEV